MKKFLLFLSLTVVASAGYAQPVSVSREVTSLKKTALSGRVNRAEAASRFSTMRSEMPKRNIAGPSNDDSQILTPPEGESLECYKLGESFGMNYLFGLIHASSDGRATNVVRGNDGRIYIERPWSQYTNNTGWLVGDVEGNTVTFKFPQFINQEIVDEYGGGQTIYNDYCLVFEYVENSDGDGWYYPAEQQTFSFRIEGDNLVADNPDELLLGMGDWEEGDEGEYEWTWQGFGDIYGSINKITDTPVVVPGNVEMERWNLIDKYTSQPLTVGFDGDDVYIAGLIADLPDAAIKGTVNNDKIEISSKQYLGVSKESWATVYCSGGKVRTETTSEGENMVFDFMPAYTLDYDAENKVIEGKDIAMLTGTRPECRLYFDMFRNPYIAAPLTTPVTSLYPPVIEEFYPKEDGYDAELFFLVPSVTPDKHVLDTSKLFWNLLINDEVFTFYPDEYTGITGDMVNVPWDHISNYITSMGNEKDLLIFTEGFDSLGIRAVYIDGDNTVESPVAYVSLSGIDAVESGETDVKKVEYFNLAGYRVENPSRGIFIRCATLSDGRKVVTKTLKY